MPGQPEASLASGGRGPLARLIQATAAHLAASGIPSPDHDAICLVAHVAGRPASEVRTAAARGDALPPGWDESRLDRLVARRAAREPLQHLTGTVSFRGLDLEVGPGVFVPRPETEVVAGVAIDAARSLPGEVRVADLGAGTGAIGLSVASEVPQARVTLVEVDEDAFLWLKRNAGHAPDEVRSRLDLVHADLASALDDRTGEFDVVVSNPPYIPPEGRPVEPEASHDPARALWGLGEDGLDVPRSVIARAGRLLRPGGVLVMEHGESQGEAVRRELEHSGLWEGVRTGRDWAGRDRYTLARRPRPMTDSTCDSSGR